MPKLTAKQKKDGTVYGRKTSLVGTVKDVDLSKRIVTGFYNSLNYFDKDWDVSLKGCYNKSIADRGPKSEAVAKFKMLRDHNWNKVLSRPHVLEERKVDGVEGLYFEAKLSQSTTGNDALIDYQEGVIDNHSFGFAYGVITYLADDTDAYKKVFDTLINPEDTIGKGGLYAVAEYIAYEGSAVPYGANELTPFLGVKSGNKSAYIEDLCGKIETMRRQIRHGKQSDEHLESLEMQMRQIEQLIKGLELEKPLKTGTQDGPPNAEDSKSRRKLILNL